MSTLSPRRRGLLGDAWSEVGLGVSLGLELGSGGGGLVGWCLLSVRGGVRVRVRVRVGVSRVRHSHQVSVQLVGAAACGVRRAAAERARERRGHLGRVRGVGLGLV